MRPTIAGFAIVVLTMLRPVHAQQPVLRPTLPDVGPLTARLRVERRAVAGRVAQIHNLRDVPLVAWAIRNGSAVTISNNAGQIGSAGGRGPLQANEVRSIPLEPASSAPASQVVFALFEDGWMEGERGYVDGWTMLQRLRADELEHWILMLSRAERLPETEARELLRSEVAEQRRQRQTTLVADRAGPFSGWLDPPHGLARISVLAGDQDQRAPGWFHSVLRVTLSDFRRARLDALRPAHLATRPGGGDPYLVRSLAIRTLDEPTTAVFVVIENNRDVAIEALGYELYDSLASVGPRSGFSTDAQGSGVPVVGPRGVREYQLHDVAVTPIAKLAFVLYTDMVFEGDFEAREKVFRDREQLADEYAYWIGVLEEARAKPPSELKAFLDGKHRLRLAAQASSADRVSPSVAPLALSVADVAAQEPDAAAAIDRHLAHMRARHQALLRHRR